MTVRSSLAPLAPSMREPDPANARRAAVEAWHAHGLVLLNPDEIERTHGWAAAQEVRNLGNLYLGKRA